MRSITILSICLILSFTVQAQLFGKKKKAKETEKKEVQDPNYFDLVGGAKVKKDSGVFLLHQNEENYFFEIPLNLLQRDFLWVSRIAKIPNGFGGGYINAGSKTNEQLVQWSQANDKLLLKSVSYASVADEELPIFQSVADNNYAPVIAAFKIEAYNPDSTALLIKVNDLFLEDVKAISGLSAGIRKSYKVSKLDKDRSFVSRFQSFSENVEVRQDLTYSASKPPSASRTGTISMQMSQSMYLLPEEPMQARAFDPRVGWFTISQIDYGSEALKADQKRYIRRWRLEPKDPEAYARGELVEPVKPIVYYLDPATPERWRPYFKKGIEDWQVAFEAAGFKNAIIAKEAPSAAEDPDWSPEDARFSTVRYVATTTRNAMGPSVSDPRSGEIIESDIVWYHNHLRSYRNRYLLETGAANPKARTLDTPEEEIGEMMRMVIAHEIGHALGLPHNMKASYAYPTDSLRSANFTQKWGLASTLMDYTRYNYVAQPGDSGVRWVRMLGPYDLYAINWGYRYFPEATSTEAEKPLLDSMIVAKKGNPVYLFGGRNSFDPSSQTEAVGDDPVKASTYGMKNLKIVAENLAEWTASPGEGYADLEELFGELLGVWRRYSAHVITNIGGIYEALKTTDDDGFVYHHLAKEEQERSMEFLNESVFSSPNWLMQKDIMANISPYKSIEKISKTQERLLMQLLSESRMQRMLENEVLNGKEAYSLREMLADLRKGIWSEVYRSGEIDHFRRALQNAYVSRLAEWTEEETVEPNEYRSHARAELKAIERLASQKARTYPDGAERYHLESIAAAAKQALKVD